MSSFERKLERLMDDFLSTHGDRFDDGLEIMYAKGRGVSIFAPWPGVRFEGGECFIVAVETQSCAEFFSLFSIKGNLATAIKQIKVQDLMALYMRGKGQIDCETGHDYEEHLLSFRRMMNGRMLVTDIYDAEHELTCWLEEPQEFISYTRQYYKINRYVMEIVRHRHLRPREEFFIAN